MEHLNCRHIDRCGGCPWAGRSLPDQWAAKAATVQGLLNTAKLNFTPVSRVRDRADLIWSEGRLGLYDQNGQEILDLEECPMMSLPLENFFLEFKSRSPAIRKGSVRLRVSPEGEKGVWLDFSNQDVKKLFEETEYLRWLSARAFVEIGQRRKALTWLDERPKLIEPVLKPWFSSFDAQGEPIPLYGPVGGFSQAGFAANRALVAAVAKAAKAADQSAWVELFSGNGNLAVALASHGFQVDAIELDELALRGLDLTLEKRPDLKTQIRASRGDVYLKPDRIPDWQNKGVLVDPPRAGLRQVLERILSHPPAALIYVSCFAETFKAEAERLIERGYRLQSLEGLDQFPHSPHCEWVGLFVFDPGLV